MGVNVEAFLAHHGVKGMKWGVRNKQVVKGDGSSKAGSSEELQKVDSVKEAMSDFYKTQSTEKLNSEGREKLKAQSGIVFPHSGTKSNNSDVTLTSEPPDINVDDLKAGGLTRNQKIAMGVGGAVAIGLLAYYGNEYLKKGKLESLADELELENVFNLEKELSSVLGSSARQRDYGERSEVTYDFFGGLKNGNALDRPGFTIPQSTTFQRLSDHAETGEGYSAGTYASFLSNDKRIYGGTSDFGSKEYTLTFQPTHPVKVPSLRTVLSEVKRTNLHKGAEISDYEAIQIYQGLSGGSWRTDSGVKLIKGLKAQGYTALVDDMDAGVLGDLPVVFFGDTKQVNAKQRTNEDRYVDADSSVPPSRRYA